MSIHCTALLLIVIWAPQQVCTHTCDISSVNLEAMQSSALAGRRIVQIKYISDLVVIHERELTPKYIQNSLKERGLNASYTNCVNALKYLKKKLSRRYKSICMYAVLFCVTREKGS